MAPHQAFLSLHLQVLVLHQCALEKLAVTACRVLHLPAAPTRQPNPYALTFKWLPPTLQSTYRPTDPQIAFDIMRKLVAEEEKRARQMNGKAANSSSSNGTGSGTGKEEQEARKHAKQTQQQQQQQQQGTQHDIGLVQKLQQLQQQDLQGQMTQEQGLQIQQQEQAVQQVNQQQGGGLAAAQQQQQQQCVEHWQEHGGGLGAIQQQQQVVQQLNQQQGGGLGAIQQQQSVEQWQEHQREVEACSSELQEVLEAATARIMGSQNEWYIGHIAKLRWVLYWEAVRALLWVRMKQHYVQ